MAIRTCRAPPRRCQPVADDRLGFAALVARHPARIDVRGVDEVEARLDEGVEQLEGRRLVGGPAEHIAAKSEWRDIQSRFPELAFDHTNLPSGTCGRWVVSASAQQPRIDFAEQLLEVVAARAAVPGKECRSAYPSG